MKLVSFDVLPNGMYCYGRYDLANASGIGVRAGSAYDPAGAVGAMHLVEHLSANSSPDYDGQIVDLMCEKYLGTPEDDINVRIDRTSTFYGHNMILYRQHMIKCFEMFANLLKQRDFSDEAFDTERAAIHQEYYVYGRDVLYNEVDELMYQTMFSGPSARRIDCEPGHLRDLDPRNVRKFIRNNHVPANMFSIMLGPPFKDVLRVVRRNFSDFKVSTTFRPSLKKEEVRLTEIKSHESSRPGFHQTHVAIGFPTEHFMSPDREGIDVLSRLLSYRVRRRLRDGNRDFDKGVYRSLAYAERTFLYGMIYIWYATLNSDFAKYGEDVVLEECRRLREELVSSEELDAMVTNQDHQYRDAFTNNVNKLVELIIEATCNGDPELVMLHSVRERLAKVNRRSIRHLANKYFTENYARVIIRPV